MIFNDMNGLPGHHGRLLIFHRADLWSGQPQAHHGLLGALPCLDFALRAQMAVAALLAIFASSWLVEPCAGATHSLLVQHRAVTGP